MLVDEVRRLIDDACPKRMDVDERHQVEEEERPAVVSLRETPNTRAAYYLLSLSFEGYVELAPEREKKCEAEKRDVRKEFEMLQAYLREIVGQEAYVRQYAYAKGKHTGRLYSIGHGMQGVWSEVRGVLACDMTDADMENAHPRILQWVCVKHAIPAAFLENFVNDREVYYNDILTALPPVPWPTQLPKGEAEREAAKEARKKAKATVLAMMNDEAPLPAHVPHTPRVSALDDEFKRLQRAVCALPQYAHFEALAADHKVKTRVDGTTYLRHNKLGSWLNLILCHHENEFLQTVRAYAKEEHDLETGVMAFDGLMFHGNLYDQEAALCPAFEGKLREVYGVEMPWTFKRHSTAITVPDDFQVYEIPERAYVQNIADKHFRDAADLGCMIGGLRAEYDMALPRRRGIYRAAAESLLVRAKRPLSDFGAFWDAPHVGLDGQVLKYYSRQSDENEHRYRVKTELNLHRKTTFSEVMLRDYFMGVLGDDVFAVQGSKSVYVWWRGRWRDEEAVLSHMLMNEVTKLFISELEAWRQKLEEVTHREAEKVAIEAGGCGDAEEGGMSREKVSTCISMLARAYKAYGASQNSNVRKLIVDQVRAYARARDPFDQKPHLFCFTNAVYDTLRCCFVPTSKYDFCLMSCGYPWVCPTSAARQRIAALVPAILPDPEYREGYVSVLKSGLTGTRPENFVIANGGGRNGKGVLHELLADTAGEYYYEGHLSLLTKPIKDGPNPEAAGMHRKRVVIFSEPEEGLGESVRLSCIKKLTGCDKLNARECHSNDTNTELCATIIMECNKFPAITGEKGEAALDRVRVIPFEMTFTSDAKKVAADPEHYKPVDKSLKTPAFKAGHRCAYFEYLMAHGGDEAWFPERTKALGAKYLTENDDLALFVLDHFDFDMAAPNTSSQREPIENFVTVKEVYAAFVGSSAYIDMTKAERRRFTQKGFLQDIQKNLLLRQFFAAPMSQWVRHRFTATVDRNTSVGLIHCKPTRAEDDVELF